MIKFKDNKIEKEEEYPNIPITKYKAKADEKIARRNKVCIAEEN